MSALLLYRKKEGGRGKKRFGGCSIRENIRDSDDVMLTPYRFSLNAPTEVVKQIIINIEAGVEVEVTIAA